MSDGSPEPESKKPVKEILVVQDQGQFTHETGDTYQGFFEAKKKDRSVKMHGPGVYITAEGEVYAGLWEADKPNASEDMTICYKDGSKYEGRIKDSCYQGKATYTYPDDSVLKGNFVENSPAGHLTLNDPNGHAWHAKASTGFAWFDPENHYYEMLETALPPKPRRNRSPRPVAVNEPDSNVKKHVKVKV